MIIHVNHIIHINHIIHVWPIVFSLSCGAFPAPSAWPGACCHAKKCDGGPKGEGCREELGKTFGWTHCTFFPGVSYCIFILWHLVGCWFSYPNQWIGLRFFLKRKPQPISWEKGFSPLVSGGQMFPWIQWFVLIWMIGLQIFPSSPR